jgi:hypothetical protein
MTPYDLYCCCSAIDTEFKRYDECRVYMRILNSRFQTLHIAILKHLGRFSMQVS